MVAVAAVPLFVHGGEPPALPAAPTVQGAASAAGMEFWPRRVRLGVDHGITVLLSAPQAEPGARLDCAGVVHELGPAKWSHPLGLLHEFSLDDAVLSLHDECMVSVLGEQGRLFRPSHAMQVAKASGPVRIDSVSPVVVSAARETVFEIQGGPFSRVVNVLWVSAAEFRVVKRSTRAEKRDRGGNVVVPFAPGVNRALPGQYLLIVENQDHTAAVYDGFVMLAGERPAAIEEVVVEGTSPRRVLKVRGFDLEGVSRALLHLPAGNLPLLVTLDEGESVPTLTVPLPVYSTDEIEGEPEVYLEGAVLNIVPRVSRLTRTRPSM